MKLDVQKHNPSGNRVLTGEIDEKASTDDVLPVAMDEKLTEFAEEVQRSRTRSGNRDLNSDLEIKADELEKLFAEHVLRSTSAPRRRSSSAGTGVVKPVAPAEPVSCLPASGISREGSATSAEFDGLMMEKMESNEGSCSNSRGRFYEKYTQIRDAKLAEERRSRGGVKEAQLKAMHEQLEHCSALMKAGLSASSFNKQDSDVEIVAELNQLTACEIKQNKQQETREVWKSEAGYGTEDLNEELESDQDRSPKVPLRNDLKIQGLKNNLLPSRNATSSVYRIPATSSPRTTTKAVNSSRRRVGRDSEHMPSQSLPNISELRKGNGARVSRIKPRPKSDYNHSSSRSVKMDPVQDDYASRSRSMGENSNLVGSIGVSSVKSNDSKVMPLFEVISECRIVQKSVKSKPFLRKGKGIGPGAGAVVVKRKALVVLENLKITEEAEGSHVQTEGSFVEINNGGDEFKMESAEEEPMAEEESNMTSAKEASMDKYESKSGSAEEASLADDKNHRLSNGTGGIADCEYSKVLELNPPIQISSLPDIITSKGSSSSTTMPESLVGSPVSCESNVQHTFPGAQQSLDFPAYVDSSIQSWELGNSNHLDQVTESDAAPMTAESGIAHNPVLANNTPRKTKINVAKGFKRLLRLGKLCKRDDPLVNDSVFSSMNSGGDGNRDNSCNEGTRVLDDVKTSKTGPSRYNSATNERKSGDISKIQGETFDCLTPVPPDDLKISERHPSGSHPKTPRSFFSLSTFRVKRSNSKLR